MADIPTCPSLTPESISIAYSKILPYIYKTPLLTSKTLNQIVSHPDPGSYPSPPPSHNSSTAPEINLSFKCENFQKTGAFKVRGAHHAVIRLIEELGIEEVRRKGIITHSSGNHAQSLALATRNFEIPSYIIISDNAPPAKIASTRDLSPNVILTPLDAAARQAKLDELIEETGAIYVPSYDHPDIILGQGTLALEFESQLRERHGSQAVFDAVITPVGGGGMLSGTGTWFSDKPGTLVFGSEPSYQGANDAERGLAQDPPSRITSVKSLTVADGLRTATGAYPWSVISDKSKVEGVFSVNEEEIRIALRLILERLKIVVEPSSAVPFAVVLFNQKFKKFLVRKQEEEGTGRAWEIGVVLSGGNVTVDALAEIYKT